MLFICRCMTFLWFCKFLTKTALKFSRYLAATQFEATAARQAFPCFDEPAMKAKFSMSIVREQDFKSLFNMPLISSSPFPKGANLMVDKFQQSVKMSTYLVAFIVCDFDSIRNTTKAGTNVSEEDTKTPLIIFQNQT